MTNEISPEPENEQSVKQYLTFKLADEIYGIEILKVQEIKGWEPVRVMPNTPAYIKGALNLRGAIVPILDLREHFGMPQVEYSPVTVVIVLCVQGENNESHTMGIVADEVSDVVDVKYKDIKNTPNLGSNIDMRYMKGMCIADNGMIMLLDADKLLDPEEFEAIDKIG